MFEKLILYIRQYHSIFLWKSTINSKKNILILFCDNLKKIWCYLNNNTRNIEYIIVIFLIRTKKIGKVYTL